MDVDNLERAIDKSRVFVVIVFITLLMVYVIWFVVGHDQTLSSNANDWGSFGDFVGGLLNPLIAFSAFYWLTVSVLIQKKELGETKKALVESSEAQKKQAKSLLESSRAQSKQAKVAFVQSQLESSKMHFQKLNSILESELSYRNALIANEDRYDSSVKIFTKSGEFSRIDEEISRSSKFIDELKNEQEELIAYVENLVSRYARVP